MNNEWLREMFLPRKQNTVAISIQITFLNLHYSSCRLVTLLKITDDKIPVSDICELSVSFKIINCSFKIFLHLFLKCPVA